MPATTGEDKAALVLLSMGPEAQETVLTRLGPDLSGRLRTRMQVFQESDPELQLPEMVLREFETMLTSPPPQAGEPSPAPAPKPPTPAPKPAPVEELPDDPIEALRHIGVDRLASALEGEQVRTITLILNCLDAEQAGEVLKRLPPETRKVVSLQLGQNISGPIVVVQRIASAVVQKCRSLVDNPAEQKSDARYRKMADVLRLLDKTERMEILGLLDQNDPETATKVKEFMYQFEDLLRIEDRSMQKLLAEIDSKSLAVALKGAPEPITEKVLNNLSKRARETLTEEMEFLGAISSLQVKQAQKQVVEVIQRLDQAGDLVMNDS